MSLFKRIFGQKGPGGPEGENSPVALAKELERCTAEAERLVAGGRHEEALALAESGLKKFPSAKRLRAVIQYVRRAASQKKLAHLKATLDERKDERAYRELTALYLDLGRNDAALEVAQRYVEEFPQAAEAHTQLGEVQLSRYFQELFSRDAWAALESFERALELNPATIRAHLLQGLLYYAIGALHHGANELAEVIEHDPANSVVSEFREQMLARVHGAAEEEDVEVLLDDAQDEQQIPTDPSVFPGGRRFSREQRGGALDPKLFAAAAAGIGKRLRIEQLAAVGTSGQPLAVAGDNKENFVRLACRLDSASRRAGRHMNFGTMRRFTIEGKFGRIVLVPAGNCAVAARAPRSVSAQRISEGLEMVVTASRAQGGEEED